MAVVLQRGRGWHDLLLRGEMHWEAYHVWKIHTCLWRSRALEVLPHGPRDSRRCSLAHITASAACGFPALSCSMVCNLLYFEVNGARMFFLKNLNYNNLVFFCWNLRHFLYILQSDCKVFLVWKAYLTFHSKNWYLLLICPCSPPNLLTTAHRGHHISMPVTSQNSWHFSTVSTPFWAWT